MKINLIIPSFYPSTVYGGPIFSTLHTCKELAKLEDVEIYVSTTNANMITRLDVETNKNIKFEENFFVKYYNETIINHFSFELIIKIWNDIKLADIIHSQVIFRPMTPIIFMYAKICKKPLVYSPRGTLGDWCVSNGNRFKKLWLKLFIEPFANTIIWHATAEQEKQEILSLYPKAKIEVIPNGIEYKLFQIHNTMNSKFFSKKFIRTEIEADKIIISMGRLQKKKGFDILINSFVNVLIEFPKSILCIAGPDEGEQSNLEKLIDDLNLNKQVYLIGTVEGQNKIDFLANADVFVLPSHNENFGNVYVESLAAGTPIIASKNTPWSEVEKYDCGKWINNTVIENSKAIVEVLNRERNEMKENSQKLAKTYDWKNIAIRFKNLYKKMVNYDERI